MIGLFAIVLIVIFALPLLWVLEVQRRIYKHIDKKLNELAPQIMQLKEEQTRLAILIDELEWRTKL